MRSGIVAAFANPEDLVEAIVTLRREGFRSMDAHIPYPVAEVIDALETPRSRVPLYALCGGLVGTFYAYLIQWWTNGFDYALNVGGRPLGSVPAFIPPTFEGAVLLTSLSAVAAFLGFSRLPRLWAPIMEVEGFERATVDQFFLAIDALDPRWDAERAKSLLISKGALKVSLFGITPEEARS